MASELTDTSVLTSAAPVSVPVEYNQRDLLLYSLGIGSNDPRYVYENHPDFAAFPTYPICLTFKGESYDALPFPPPIISSFPQVALQGVNNLLDAEKIIEKVNEIPKGGAKMKLVGSTVGVHKKGPGALVESQYELVGEDGTVYYRMISAALLVGAKDFVDSGRTCSVASPPPKSEPMATVDQKLNPEIASLFRLSGDYNPLHVDPSFATMFGFKQPIVHGLCTLGHVTRAVLDTTAGGDQKRFKSIQLRFSSPVLPGETLSTEVWKVSPTVFIFQTKVKESGKVCVSNGRFELTPEGKL